MTMDPATRYIEDPKFRSLVDRIRMEMIASDFTVADIDDAARQAQGMRDASRPPPNTMVGEFRTRGGR
jgi:hypothetical protein